MAITIERNQKKIQSLQIIDYIYVCVRAPKTSKTQIVKTSKMTKRYIIKE